MKATRWILFCLLAFGLGTGVAFATHPPTIGIPKADAADLATDLSKIQAYAEAGRCDAVRGRVNSASATIANLPVSTNQKTQNQLSSALDKIRSSALTTCQDVADQKLKDAAPTTPETTPEPTTPESTVPTTPITAPTTPSPDPGIGDGSTSPDSSGGTTTDGGDGTTDGSGDVPSDGGDQGGITLPNGQEVPGAAAVRQRLHEARKQIERALGGN